jgi:O-antigen ligase
VNQVLNHGLFFLLMLLVVVSPLPLGSNREWSWSLCALIAGFLGLVWVVANLGRSAKINLQLSPLIPVLFALACSWVLVQITTGVPVGWQHPLWSMASEVLGMDLPGRITLSAEDSWIALMRLLSYALVFFLAFQFGSDRGRAQLMFGWLMIAGLIYAVFGLAGYWGGYTPDWLFGGKVLPHDVRSTFINRNHFATWQGLTMLCAMAWFYQKMAKPVVKPYAMPQDREARVEEFIMRAWKPLIVLLLLVTALVLTHSRAGFAAALAGTVVLFLLLDRRASSKSNRARIVVITALAVAGIAFYMTSEALLDRINRTDITTEERLAVYANINRAIGDNPALGFGYGAFSDSFLLYDQNESPVRYDRAHNTWLENAFELGVPAALVLYLALGGLVWTCWRGMQRRHRDWVYPATGVAASVLVGLHAMLDFSLQLPAVAILYACIMGVACAQSYSSVEHR